jgi:hypothetical protein
MSLDQRDPSQGIDLVFRMMLDLCFDKGVGECKYSVGTPWVFWFQELVEFGLIAWRRF